MKAVVELDAGGRDFTSGLLAHLIEALRTTHAGDLLALTSHETALGAELERWCRFTGNSLVETTAEADRIRWVFRHGAASTQAKEERPIGSRLWLYTNFDCNLACDYCCVRSSPKAPRRELGLDRIRRIAAEVAELDIGEIFLTGGEPFLLADIGAILTTCAAAAPTTVLTNGMLFSGRRLEILRALPRGRLTLQISLDSPTAQRHDAHRGKGSWTRALKGIRCARDEGFRVRLAATVSSEKEAEEFRNFLDAEQIGEEDRVIRRIALRGAATEGVAIVRADLLPEMTITADGVYWHPVGAEDADLLVTTNIFPLVESLAAVRRAFDRESDNRRRLASIFNCA